MYTACCRYAHVDPNCLEASPTNVWWHEWMQSGGARQHGAAVIDMNTDYDGLAVVWGIGHYTSSVEQCAEACRTYTPGPEFGGTPHQFCCKVHLGSITQAS